LFSDSVRLDWTVFNLELPDLGTLRPVALAIALVAALLLFRVK
jgi:chromate transporter